MKLQTNISKRHSPLVALTSWALALFVLFGTSFTTQSEESSVAKVELVHAIGQSQIDQNKPVHISEYVDTDQLILRISLAILHSSRIPALNNISKVRFDDSRKKMFERNISHCFLPVKTIPQGSEEPSNSLLINQLV